MKYLLLIISYCLGDIHGKSFSLMHPEHNHSQDDKGELTLNGIVYVSPAQWVIWLNNKRIAPDKSPAWVKIISVSASNVTCEYLFDGVWYKVTLETYDTFTPHKKPEQPNLNH